MKLPPVITRSARRRRVAFTIRPEDGRLEVLAPLRASAAEIERIIAHNPDLIERLRRQFEQVEARRTVPEFREGGEFHYLGTLYPVRFTRKVLAFDRAFLIPAGDEAAVRTELEQLYRKLAAELLEPKVSDAAGRFGLTYRHVRVGGARGRWGSCSRDGGLNFSWRLVAGPSRSSTMWSSMSSPTGSNSTTPHATGAKSNGSARATGSSTASSANTCRNTAPGDAPSLPLVPETI